ncbi:MAG: DUF454 family protein [Alphaproteobacteria bacterium GM7ARS4]|nr:DUF454 family protein [Alphaproteobacteria bacterium GM7ARS4]
MFARLRVWTKAVGGSLLKIRNWLLFGCGSFFFSLGMVGTVVPGMPTTVFWIIATWFFTYSCPWMTKKIYAMGPIGAIIRKFNERIGL